MDYPLLSSTSSSTSSKSNNQHITISKKLHEISRRIQYAKRIIKEEGALTYGGCTDLRAGPPSFLRGSAKDNWIKDIRDCTNKCVWKYLLPAYSQKIEYYKNKVQTDIVDKLTDENRESIERGIKLGRDRADRKWDRREGITHKDRSKVMLEVGSYKEEEIGILKRGETKLALDEILIINNNIKHTKDTYRIIAHGIYGSGRYSRLIARNVWKYIQMHEIEEKRKFTPFLGKLNNNTYRWIHTWSMFCAFIRNRDLLITTYELDIISSLYDVTLSIFRQAEAGFKCTWKAQLQTFREVNILTTIDNEWLHLVKTKKQVYDKIFYSETHRYKLTHNLLNNKHIIANRQVLDCEDREELGASLLNNDNIHTVRKDEYVSGEDVEIEDIVREESKLDYKNNKKVEEEIIINNNNLDIQSDTTYVNKNGENLEINYNIEKNRKDYKKSKFNNSIESLTESGQLNSESSDIRREGYINNRDIVGDKEDNEEDIERPITRNDISDSLIARLFGEDSDKDSKTVELYSSTQSKGDSQKHIKISSRRNARKKLVWQLWRKKVRDNKRNVEKKEDKRLHKEGIKEKNKQLVFDFTREGLKTSEIELLSKGESFCVTNHRVDFDRLKTDIFNFSRRLRLHDEFREPKKEITSQKSSSSNIPLTQRDRRSNVNRVSNSMSLITQTPLGSRRSSSTIQQVDSQHSTQIDRLFNNNNIRKPISIYDPDSQNRNLNRYIQCIQEESLLTMKHEIKFKDNITREHRQAIKSLKDKIDKKDIIITKADKGSGLVAVDYDTYISKGTKYIEDEAKAYNKVGDSEKSIVNKLIKARNNIVQKLKNNQVIEIETATYCNKQLEEKITGLKFYYKIHKDSNILTMPLRPLQSCINAPTHHLSQVLTDILQPFLKNSYIPTYLQDSNQLLYKLERLQQLSSNHTLISSDVAALYPSIPHEEGMLAITEFLEHNSGYSEQQIDCIVKALELVITENYVVWNSQIYKQTSGVAMGTPVAVAYANIFMHWIDEEIKQKAPFIMQHYRYIDDNLFILPSNNIEELMEIANSILYPHIRFTYETLDRDSDIGLSFLDTLLYITEEGKIVSRLYTKKTDKHAYLLPTSYHPRHITKNIPLAVFNRIRRLCSKEEWFQVDGSKAIEWLEDREYNYKDIKRALETSMSKDRTEMIDNIESKRGKDKNKDKTEEVFNIPFLVTYSHNALRIREVLKQRNNLLDASFVATKVRPRLTFRRQKNIADIIVQKGLRGPIENKEERIITLCGEKPKYRIICPCKGKHDQKICRCCAHIKFTVEGVKNKLHKRVDCDTKNVIYMIGCRMCSKKYIGETQQKLKERLLQHLSNIGKLTQPLYMHFNQIHAAENLYITILETVKSGEPAFRKVREAWWINRLQTLEPRGFNVKLDCNQVYQANKNTIQIEKGIKKTRNRYV